MPDNSGQQETFTNVLDDYDVSTYHLKLFVVAPTDIQEGTELSEGLIIAESGATDMGIDDLEMDQIVGFDSRTYTTSAFPKFRFKITEPLGSTFFDRIKVAAQQMSIPNFVKMPFILEITFLGRDVETGEPVIIPDTKRQFPIQIHTVDLDVDKGGSSYTCTAVHMSNYAFNDSHGTVQFRTSIEAKNVKDALEKLAIRLNSDAENLNRDSQQATDQNKGLADTYSFTIDPELLRDNGMDFFGKEKMEYWSDRTDSFLEFEPTPGAKNITMNITPGTSINRIIDELMIETSYLQIRINDQIKIGNNPKEWQAPKSIYKIRPNVTIGNYDLGRGEFTRHIEYIIEPFSFYPVNPTQGLETESIELPSDHTGPISDSDAVVYRNYAYIYTGENTQVIDFNAKVNLAWYAEVPRSDGRNQNPTFHDAGRLQASEDDVAAETSEARNTIYKKENTEPYAIPVTNAVTVDGFVDRPSPQADSWPTTNRASHLGSADTGGTVIGNRTRNKVMTSHFLRDYIQTNNNEYFNMELTVRGDPFWITIDQKNYGKAYFIFRMGLPQEPSEETGLIEVVSDTLVSGIFLLFKITHRFQSGKFTQVINGKRDMLSRIKSAGDQNTEGEGDI